MSASFTPRRRPMRLSMRRMMRVTRLMPRLRRPPSRRLCATGKGSLGQHSRCEENMSYSFTITETETFTVTHARHMAAKVAADLKRMQRFYGSPSDSWIAHYEAEITLFMKGGYLGVATYGYKRDGKWIEPTLRYTARALAGAAANDDDPGRVPVGANIV